MNGSRLPTRSDMAEVYERVLWNGLRIDAPLRIPVGGLAMVGLTVQVLARVIESGPFMPSSALSLSGSRPLLAGGAGV